MSLEIKSTIGDKIKATFDALKEFFEALIKLKDNFEALEKSITGLKNDIVDNFDKVQDQLSQVDCSAAFAKAKSLLSFKNKVIKGVEIIAGLAILFKEMFTESKTFFDNIEKEKEQFKKVFTEKKKEGNDDNVKLMWNYSTNEDRLDDFAQHKRVLEIMSGTKPEPIVKKDVKPTPQKKEEEQPKPQAD